MKIYAVLICIFLVIFFGGVNVAITKYSRDQKIHENALNFAKWYVDALKKSPADELIRIANQTNKEPVVFETATQKYFGVVTVYKLIENKNDGATYTIIASVYANPKDASIEKRKLAVYSETTIH